MSILNTKLTRKTFSVHYKKLPANARVSQQHMFVARISHCTCYQWDVCLLNDSCPSAGTVQMLLEFLHPFHHLAPRHYPLPPCNKHRYNKHCMHKPHMKHEQLNHV